MSNEWDGKVVMSTPGGPIVTMSLGDLLARKDAEIERLRTDNERLKREPELLRAELISLSNAARKALADAYDRARNALEGKS